MKTAIVLGATGLTGSLLLKKLLGDSRYQKIILFSRHSADIVDEKIEEHLIDMFQLEDYEKDFKADQVFCCVGTTRDKTPDKETYRKVDHGIPVTAAALSKKNNIKNFVVISAMGANPGSTIFYNRIKGEMERDVMAQSLENLYILRPSLIQGERKEERKMENVAKKVMKVVDPLLKGPMDKYRSIKSETIATAMVVLANEGYKKTILESDDIREVAK